MTTHAADIGGYTMRSAGRDRLRLKMSVPIGSTGAVGTITKDDPAWGLTRDSAGTYSGTFPKGVRGFPAVHYVGDGTVKGHYFTAFSATGGTFTVKFHDAATPTTTDPESGAVLYFEVDVETRGD